MGWCLNGRLLVGDGGVIHWLVDGFAQGIAMSLVSSFIFPVFIRLIKFMEFGRACMAWWEK